MLEFMGVLIRNQPKPKQEKADLLRRLIAEEPTKAQTAYDVIVFNKIPEVSKQVVQDGENVKAHYMGVMARLLESEQADAMRSAAEEMAKSLESKIEEHGRKALAEAAKAYRPVMIRNGSKTKKISGVMPAEFERIVQLASQRVPVMMVGPAGCGKTYIAGKAAKSLHVCWTSRGPRRSSFQLGT
jgi:ATP-dependent protease Clp ATPase subunit